HRPLHHLGSDELHAVGIGAESLPADNERQRDRVETKDERPFLGDDVEQAFQAVRLEPGEDCLVNGSDGTRMAAGKCQEVLIGLFGGAKALAQTRDGALLEGDHLAHAPEDIPEAVNFILAWLSGRAARTGSTSGSRR